MTAPPMPSFPAATGAPFDNGSALAVAPFLDRSPESSVAVREAAEIREAELPVKPPASSAGRAAIAGSSKTRAADEPVVKRMMEKFGAEIRMVTDRSER
jgi:hypothetical protein